MSGVRRSRTRLKRGPTRLLGQAPRRGLEERGGVSTSDGLGGMSWLITHSHEMAQQVINHLAHEAEQSIGIGCG